MRVVVASDQYPALSSAQAGAAIATAWAELRAQVAVVPMGNALEGLQQALVDLLAGSLDSYDDGLEVVTAGPADALLVAVRPEHRPAGDGIDGAASSWAVGEAVYRAVEAARRAGHVPEIVVEVGDIVAHDGGAGFLAALGASADRPLDTGVDALAGVAAVDLEPVRAWLGDARLTLAVPADQRERHLVGLRGITSVRGHAAALDPARLLATDQALVDLTAATGASVHAQSPGGGAAGGLGFAALALGGRVLTGAALCRDLAGLDRTIAQADLVVTGGGQLDFGRMGGDVLATVVEAATEALRPVVVVAGQNFVSPRELRTIGVEAAYSVRPGEPGGQADGPVRAEEITRACRPVAASWTW